MIAEILSWAADMMLAFAALYISGLALYGYYLERTALRLDDPDARDTQIEDARGYYASASLSRPWLLFFIFAGTLIKVGLRLCEVV